MRLDTETRWVTLSFYYFADDYSLNNPYPTAQAGANVPGFNARNLGRAQLVTLSDTKSFSATVNEVHLSFMRNANQVGQPVGGVGPSLASQGFTNIVPLAPSIEGIENMAFMSHRSDP